MAACAAALALGACGSGGGTTTAASANAPLTGTQWVLDGTPAAWIRFAPDGTVTGTDACNGFTGGYTVSGADLRFGPLAGTKKFCPPPAGDTADRVLAGLQATRRYEIAGDELRLLGADGAVALRYRATTPSVEGRWTVTSVLYKDAIRGVIEGTDLTADFGPDGRVSGSGGCNTFGADYTAAPPKLRITSLVSTERACAAPDANEQEQGYFAALSSARTFEQTGDELTILDGQGRMAVTLLRAGAGRERKP